ncbi:MAG TPA: GAF domain-containing protein [Candidatus Acidoferrum sp.]|nr:GAF domain-containing protein [Candidatus Acidoferrum sp.]
MADFPPVRIAENAILDRKSARKMLQQARAIWSRAHQATEEPQLQGSELDAQIEELAKSDGFRRQYAANMLTEILNAAMEGTKADMGNIQLYDAKAARLIIRVQHGFRRPFLDFFDSVHSGEAACGSALQAGKRVVVPDVTDTPVFRSADSLRVLLNAGVRSVQSTPIVSQSGAVLGMLSTHHRTVKTFAEKDLEIIDHFARQAAAVIEWQQAALRQEDASRR